MKRKMKKTIALLMAAMLLSSSVMVSAEEKENAGQTSDSAQNADNLNKATTVIYDIAEGYMIVPYHQEYLHNTYQWNHLTEVNGYRYYAEEGKKISKLGIDVSKFQGTIDWQQVKQAGIEFVIIRLGYRGYGSSGSLNMDDRFLQNIQGAQAAGLTVGVYFFSQAVSEAEAMEEADYVLNAIAPYQITGPIAFDTERIVNHTARTDQLTNAELTYFTRVFCDRIRQAGKEPMIYANAKWLTTRLDLGQLQDIPVWYADYQNQPIYPYAYEMWQYTEKGSVPGIGGAVDINVWFQN